MLLPGVLPFPMLTFYNITHDLYTDHINPCMYEQIHWHPQSNQDQAGSLRKSDISTESCMLGPSVLCKKKARQVLWEK